MRNRIVQLAFLLSIVTVSAQNYNYLGTYSSNGTPDYLEEVSDVVSVETQEMISNALPESFPVPDYNPHYITSGYDTDLNLDEDADVWVTFVDEGAGYRNVLGFYTYPIGNPPATAPNPDQITIIFPNVSALGSGGGLQTGDKVKIGTFDEGTAIGWVLFANAWRHNKVGYGYWSLFSNPIYNPEPLPELQHHNVLLTDPDNERIILGFEDIRRDYRSCDNDFNDAIFYVTANPYEAIVTTNYVDVDEATPDVSSANDGGLESNGNLAGLIAQRNFNRNKTGNATNTKVAQKKFNKAQRKASKTTRTTLENYLPETGMFQTEVAQISSPEDLLGVTNATEVFSVDMYDGEHRVSAVLATATSGAVYDHSKAICDRLNQATLEDVRPVTVRGHRIISSKIIRNQGHIEYTLGFSVKLGTENNEVFSFWNIDQYPKGDYYNFQIWGTSFSQVFSIANHIFDTMASEKSLISSDIEDNTPKVFVKSGVYKKGKLILEIVNKARVKEMIFYGNASSTEVSDRTSMEQTIALSGSWNETVVIETGALFDVGVSIGTNASQQKDVLYLADGPWGVDYTSEFAQIDTFEITQNEINLEEGVHLVERNIAVSGSVKGTVNVFRHLLAGNQELEVEAYNAIDFEMTGNQPVEVILMTGAIENWNDRLRTTITPSLEKHKYTIPFENFVDTNGNSRDLTSIQSLVFSLPGNYNSSVPFSLKVENVQLKTASTASVDADVVERTGLKNYPNPFVSSTTIELPHSSRAVNIQVYDAFGRMVDQQKLVTKDGNSIRYISKFNSSGMYNYRIQDDAQHVFKGSFMFIRK